MLIIKSIVFILSLLPFGFLTLDIISGNLIDPIEEITNPTGQWALRFLLITLSITPIVIIFKQAKIIKLRRMLGLFAFFYMVLHLGIWLIDTEFSIANITNDIIKRNYILIGFISFILTFILAITSNKFSIKKLGKKWKSLHNLIYLIIILSWVHFYLQSKSGITTELLIYLIIILMLLLFRINYTKLFLSST